jgi:hypothetical protein
LLITNANSVSQLNGSGGTQSIGAYDGFGGSAGAVVGDGYFGGTFGLGFGAGVSVVTTPTYTIPLGSSKDPKKSCP